MEAVQEFLCPHASRKSVGIAPAIHEVEMLSLLVAAAWEDAMERVWVSRAQGALILCLRYQNAFERARDDLGRVFRSEAAKVEEDRVGNLLA